MSKFSTRTAGASGEVVPWLAAKGPLVYTPESLPNRDYYFQYGWVLPAILRPGPGRRRHHYFGAWSRDDADEIFRFWTNARTGNRTQIHLPDGRMVGTEGHEVAGDWIAARMAELEPYREAGPPAALCVGGQALREFCRGGHGPKEELVRDGA